MKQLIVYTLSVLFFTGSLNAEIIKTTNIQDIREEITENTLVLFNIAEVLMDTEMSLGTQPWRKFVRERVEPALHDQLTLFVFENVPPKSPDPSTPELIRELQSKGQMTFALTSRGRHEWYSSQVPDVDLITEKLMLQIGIDFSQTQLNQELSVLPELFVDYYHAGVIYATNAMDKGALLIEILETTGYRPSKIIFVDDKVASLVSMEATLASLDTPIPFMGYAYSQTAVDHADFDPLVANIQLDRLINEGQILPDEEAMQIKDEQYSNVDLDQYFEAVVDEWNAFKQIPLEEASKIDR